MALENSTSTSPQDLQSYSQQPSQQTQQTNQCQGHYIYQQQSHSPIAQPQSPVSINKKKKFGDFPNFSLSYLQKLLQFFYISSLFFKLRFQLESK